MPPAQPQQAQILLPQTEDLTVLLGLVDQLSDLLQENREIKDRIMRTIDDIDDDCTEVEDNDESFEDIEITESKSPDQGSIQATKSNDSPRRDPHVVELLEQRQKLAHSIKVQARQNSATFALIKLYIAAIEKCLNGIRTIIINRVHDFLQLHKSYFEKLQRKQLIFQTEYDSYIGLEMKLLQISQLLRTAYKALILDKDETLAGVNNHNVNDKRTPPIVQKVSKTGNLDKFSADYLSAELLTIHDYLQAVSKMSP